MTTQPHPILPPRRRPLTVPPRASPRYPGQPSDYALLTQWRNQQLQPAATRLYRRYAPEIYRFFRNKAADRHDAADLTSETFMRLFHRRPTYPPIHTYLDGQPNVRPYLFGIAKFVLLAYIRRKHRSESIDLSTQTFVELVPRSPSSILFVCRRLHAVSRALRTIPAEDQILLEAKFQEEMSERELAVLLEIPVTSVPGRQRRALQRLREAVHNLKDARTLPDMPTTIDGLSELLRTGGRSLKPAQEPDP